MKNRISKQRNKHIQRMLVEAARLAPRYSPELAVLYERERQRGNANRATAFRSAQDGSPHVGCRSPGVHVFSMEYRGGIGAIGASMAHNSAKNSAKFCNLRNAIIMRSQVDPNRFWKPGRGQNGSRTLLNPVYRYLVDAV